ncbi:MAG: PLDc N-terminal domain-containing protein [Leptospirales bacterium]|jgi:hypothetical protein
MLVLLILLALPFTFIWIWAIMDCARHETDARSRHRWLLIILLFSSLGALLYLILRRPHRPKRLPATATDGDGPHRQQSIFVPRRR